MVDFSSIIGVKPGVTKMRISRLGGIIASNDSSLNSADGKIETIFEADGAIAVGGVAKLDVTGNTDCRLVIAGAAILDHRQAVGIYEGEGGTGAVASVSGTSGKAAVDGDVIMVTTYGKAVALQDGTTDTIPGEALQIEAGATGYLIGGVTAVTNGGTNSVLFTCMEAVTTDGAAGSVFCHCM